jgi:hypothetical protein
LRDCCSRVDRSDASDAVDAAAGASVLALVDVTNPGSGAGSAAGSVFAELIAGKHQIANNVATTKPRIVFILFPPWYEQNLSTRKCHGRASLK